MLCEGQNLAYQWVLLKKLDLFHMTLDEVDPCVKIVAFHAIYNF